MTNKILVTGGYGYIGSHTVIALQEQGFECIVIDNLVNSDLSVGRRIERVSSKKHLFYNVDIGDRAALMDVFSKEGPISTVIHFAAFKSVNESVLDPVKYFDNNVSGLINVIKASEVHGADLVFSSSCTVYGSALDMPVKENAPTHSQESPYGATKAVAENLIHHAVVNSEFRATSLRYFNPVGAHESGLIGEVQISKSVNLLPIIVDVALGKLKTLEIFGDDYPTDDGSCIRDFIHVCDVAEAHVAAVKHMMTQDINYYDIFNIGCGRGTSVLEMVSSFEFINKVNVPKRIVGRRAGDVGLVWADVSKSKMILNWEATRSLEVIVKTAWDFALRMDELADRK
jgi:UDP-glucose 4-epimerase